VAQQWYQMLVAHWPYFAAGAAAGLTLAVVLGRLFAAMGRLLAGEPVTFVHFSPKGGCMEAIVAELNTARHEVLVQAYSFTCPDIATALANAVGRGVRVHVLLDRSNEEESYSELGDLERHGVDVQIDASHAIAHNKVMVIDRRTVVTGSFNFTRQAERENAENLVILRDHRALAARYRDNFHAHRDHCHAPGEVTLKAVHSHGRRAA
jgi:phosphatidylserine/phosphatidylglycerophosphate/cardiolipin synthase-like enzyme